MLLKWRQFFQMTFILALISLCFSCAGGSSSSGFTNPFSSLSTDPIATELVGDWNLNVTVTQSDCGDIVSDEGSVTLGLRIEEDDCFLTNQGESVENENESHECEAAGTEVVVYSQEQYEENGCALSADTLLNLAADSDEMTSLSGDFEVRVSLSEGCGTEITSCTLRGEVNAEMGYGQNQLTEVSITELSVADSEIEKGQTTTLTWSIEDENHLIEKIEIENLGEVGSNGALEISPTVTTVYTLKIYMDGEPVKARSVVVTVVDDNGNALYENPGSDAEMEEIQPSVGETTPEESATGESEVETPEENEPETLSGELTLSDVNFTVDMQTHTLVVNANLLNTTDQEDLMIDVALHRLVLRGDTENFPFVPQSLLPVVLWTCAAENCDALDSQNITTNSEAELAQPIELVFDLPEDLEPGRYSAQIRVAYEDDNGLHFVEITRAQIINTKDKDETDPVDFIEHPGSL